LLGYITQEAMPFLLQLLLPEVPLCSIWHLRQQGRVPMLQQHEDQGRQPQVSLKLIQWLKIMYCLIYHGFPILEIRISCMV
ncbi:hypothetical protein BAE44_0009179, partial [Dichanthelium oligosanthes]